MYRKETTTVRISPGISIHWEGYYKNCYMYVDPSSCFLEKSHMKEIIEVFTEIIEGPSK